MNVSECKVLANSLIIIEAKRQDLAARPAILCVVHKLMLNYIAI